MPRNNCPVCGEPNPELVMFVINQVPWYGFLCPFCQILGPRNQDQLKAGEEWDSLCKMRRARDRRVKADQRRRAVGKPGLVIAPERRRILDINGTPIQRKDSQE